jgi:hypothetical protein
MKSPDPDFISTEVILAFQDVNEKEVQKKGGQILYCSIMDLHWHRAFGDSNEWASC